MEFTDKGREAFARVTKRIAERGSKIIPPAGHAARADLPALRDHARQQDRLAGDDRLRLEPRGHRRPHRRADREHRQLPGDERPGGEPAHRRAADRPQADLEHAGLGDARPAGARPGPARGRGGPRAHDPLPARSSTACSGLVATAALLIYAVLLFALVKLIPITLTLPGIAGMVLTLAVAADANIVMFERIKEEVRAGQIDPGRDLHRLHEGAEDDHRRERRDDRRGVHPVHAGHGRDQGLRVHARRRHHRLAVHGRAGHLGDPRHDGAQPRAAARRARSAWARRAPAAGASTSWAGRAGSSPSRA